MEDPQASGKAYDRAILGRLFGLTRPYRGTFYILVCLTLLGGVLTPIRPYLIQLTIDGQIAQGDLTGLGKMVLLMIALLIGQSVAQYFQTYLSEWLGQSVIADLRSRLFDHISHLRLRFFDKQPIGRLVTRNISDIETLADVFSEGLASIAGDILQLFFILVLMFWTDWRLTAVSLSTLPLLIVATYIFKEKVKKSFSDVRTAVANLNTFVQERLSGMAEVQLYAAEARELDKFRQINREHRRANIRSVLYYSVYFPVAEVIGAAGTGLLVWYGAGQVLAAEVTLGTLVAFIMYISMFFRPIRTIADRVNTLQMGVVSAERVLRLLDHDDTTPRGGNLCPDRLKGDVCFQGVEFAYLEGQPVLRGLDLEVRPGERIALVGATGAGKTSVISLLNRFYEPTGGQILLDGAPLKDYALTCLRSRIGLVLQDVFLFSGTIRQNITLGNPDLSDERIWQAARALGAAPFIEALPQGLDQPVLERGASLSVGQRQLISFIRAMVYQPDIIVLDEATSSVDTETEGLIQQAIETVLEGRTSIVIAHRLSTIRQADRIYVLEQGRVVEQGTHDELLTLEGGHYAHLHRIQFEAVG